MGNKIVVKTLDGYARVGFGLGNDGTFTIKGCTLDNQSVTSSVNFITISKKPD